MLENLKQRKLFDNREMLSKIGCRIDAQKTRDQIYTEVVNAYNLEVESSLTAMR